MSIDDRLLTYGGYCSQQVEATDGDKQFFEAKQAIYKDLMELLKEGEVSTDKAWNKARDNTIREYRTKIKEYCGIG